uniref:Uncharacterized protein n=1 Tax=Zonotrichia albicollis TaxID=44394 RepID=A0A8D2QAX7_ZONAL
MTVTILGEGNAALMALESAAPGKRIRKPSLLYEGFESPTVAAGPLNCHFQSIFNPLKPILTAIFAPHFHFSRNFQFFVFLTNFFPTFPEFWAKAMPP